MKALDSTLRALIFTVTILLLILAFPSTLHATLIPTRQLSAVSVPTYERLLAHGHRDRAFAYRREGDRRGSLLDQDIRVHAATVLIGDPLVSKSAQGAHVPLTVLVITAPILLDV